MNPPKTAVSIIIPAKNTAAYLNECINSILNQSFADWELIVVDDHSGDGSFNIVNSFAKNDPRIKVIKNTGTGIIEALRLAYQHTSGTYITRMDSDDTMTTDKIELLHKQLQLKGKGYLAVGLVNYFSANSLGEGYHNYASWLNELCKTETNFSDIYKECTIPSPCWMVHRDDLDACNAFNPNIYPEDYDLAFRFRKQGLKITGVHKVLHNWRDYQTRTSRTDEHYADNNFAELKVKHFIDQDYNSGTPLTLWGAGRKGKKIARLLQKENLKFKWLCNNENKLGKDIYGVILGHFESLNSTERCQVIVAVKSMDDAADIESFITTNSQHQYFRFS